MHGKPVGSPDKILNTVYGYRVLPIRELFQCAKANNPIIPKKAVRSSH